MNQNDCFKSAWIVHPCIKEYCWGKKGKESALYQYIQNVLTEHAHLPLAELWVGTHPAGLNTLPQWNNNSLQELVKISGGVDTLPFLYKVLSISRPLSIQVHPDKELATILHSQNPLQYPDVNDKPEMVIALTPMRLLHGFRPLSEILEFCELYPHLKALWIGKNKNNLGETNNALNSIHSGVLNLMHTENDQIQASSSIFRSLLDEKKHHGEKLSKEESMFLEINEENSNDIGAWFTFILNIKVLQPFEGLLIGPNEPHSYIMGDCVEAMNCSDNVIRAGLTTKFRDIPSFLHSISRQKNEFRSFLVICENYSKSIIEFIPVPITKFPSFRILVLRFDTTSEVSIIIEASKYVKETREDSVSETFHAAMIAHTGVTTFSRGDAPAIEIRQGTVWIICVESQTRMTFVRKEDKPCLITICIPNCIRCLYSS